MAGDELNSDDDSDEESDDEDDDDDPDNFEDTSESDQQDSKVDSLKSKLYERARAMKQDGQPINLLPRYVHSRQKPLVEQQQQQLPTTRKEDFHCQFAGCTTGGPNSRCEGRVKCNLHNIYDVPVSRYRRPLKI